MGRIKDCSGDAGNRVPSRRWEKLKAVVARVEELLDRRSIGEGRRMQEERKKAAGVSVLLSISHIRNEAPLRQRAYMTTYEVAFDGDRSNREVRGYERELVSTTIKE